MELKKSHCLHYEDTYKQNWQKKKINNARSHQFKVFDKLNNLCVTERNGKQISIQNTGERLIEFSSCSYLGLDQDARVTKASSDSVNKFGVNFAVARTRLKTSNNIELETLLSKIFCNASVTIFTSLHLTHLGFLPLLGSGELPSFPLNDKGPLFIMDKVAHNCMQVNRALLSQFGEVQLIDFQDKIELEGSFKFAKETGRTAISISDSVCSMGGFVPIKLLLKLATQFNGYVYLDDAHGTSIYGENGQGYALNMLSGKFHPRLILTPSLSKGFGSNMGVLALPTKADMDMVHRFASVYLFSNPPANSVIDAAIASAKIHLSNEIFILQKKLWDNVHLFDKSIDCSTLNINEKTPIRGVNIGDEDKTIACALYLREKGYFVTAAMYPTVELGKAMIRISLSALHSTQDVENLCGHINYFLNENKDL